MRRPALFLLALALLAALALTLAWRRSATPGPERGSDPPAAARAPRDAGQATAEPSAQRGPAAGSQRSPEAATPVALPAVDAGLAELDDDALARVLAETLTTLRAERDARTEEKRARQDSEERVLAPDETPPRERQGVRGLERLLYLEPVEGSSGTFRLYWATEAEAPEWTRLQRRLEAISAEQAQRRARAIEAADSER